MTVSAVFQGGKVKLENSAKTGVKIPPQTTILSFDQGKLTSPQPDRSHIDIPFAPTPKSSVMMKNGGKLSAVTTFADIIKQHGCTALYQHHSFTKGSVPPAFSVKKATVMAPVREDLVKALNSQMHNKSPWQWTWIVEIQKEKVMPVAVAVTNKKQVIVKGNAADPL